MPPPAAAKRTAKGPSKAQQAFQLGLAALAQWVEREGAHWPVPRSHSEEIAVDGETEPVAVKLDVWISNTKQRRDKLTQEQRAALQVLRHRRGKEVERKSQDWPAFAPMCDLMSMY